MKLKTIIGGLSLALLLQVPALAGDVTGKIKGATKDSVVWLEGLKTAAPGASLKVSQQNKVFTPGFMVVVAGQTVNMLNNDAIAHNVFSRSPAKTFNLGIYPKGQSKPVKFDKPGVVTLGCTIHSNMKGTVVVVPNKYYAVPSGGNFRIAGVPAGKYTLKYWSAGGQRSKSITVGAGPLKVDL